MTHKILVYDTSRVFSRFLKTKLDDSFELTVINSKREFKKQSVSAYDSVFFIANDVFDALLFANIYKDTKPLFLGIAAKYLEDEFALYDGFIPLDLKLPKKELTAFINTHLFQNQTYQAANLETTI